MTLRNKPRIRSPSASSGRPLQTTPVMTSDWPINMLITLRCAASSTLLIGTAAFTAKRCRPSETSSGMWTTRFRAGWRSAAINSGYQGEISATVASLKFSCQNRWHSSDCRAACSSAMNSRNDVANGFCSGNDSFLRRAK